MMQFSALFFQSSICEVFLMIQTNYKYKTLIKFAFPKWLSNSATVNQPFLPRKGSTPVYGKTALLQKYHLLKFLLLVWSWSWPLELESGKARCFAFICISVLICISVDLTFTWNLDNLEKELQIKKYLLYLNHFHL